MLPELYRPAPPNGKHEFKSGAFRGRARTPVPEMRLTRKNKCKS